MILFGNILLLPYSRFCSLLFVNEIKTLVIIFRNGGTKKTIPQNKHFYNALEFNCENVIRMDFFSLCSFYLPFD